MWKNIYIFARIKMFKTYLTNKKMNVVTKNVALPDGRIITIETG